MPGPGDHSAYVGEDASVASYACFAVGKEKYQQKKKQAENKDQDTVRWVELFESLSRYLGVVVQ